MGISRDHYNGENIGNAIFKGALARFGKSQWSSFASGVTVYYGEYKHFQGRPCEIWENLNGVSSFEGFMRESLRDLGKSQ